MNRNDFPLLRSDSPIVYLDSAATSLKPQPVIDAVVDYYQNYPVNVARGLYSLGIKATEKFETAREKIAKFINAPHTEEIIFVRGTTEAINLVAYSWGRLNITEGDEIVTTVMDHHSNFIPWQQLALENGATLKMIDISDNGDLDIFDDKILNSKSQVPNKFKIQISKLKTIITKKTKLVAIPHVSNVLGTINPVKEIISEVKRINPHCLVLIDGAQGAPHMPVDVQEIGCDFYAFSGHKMLGPTGIGVLWGRKELLEEMAPFQFGGSMIRKVAIEQTTFADLPAKFEGGTPHIAGVLGLGAAVEYLEKIGMVEIRKHEREMTEYALARLKEFNNIQIYGPEDAKYRAGVLTFNLHNEKGRLIHPHDVGEVLARENICVRVGHHCAMPLHTRLGTPASVRASLYIYNEKKDVDRLIEGLRKVREVFS
ncbi:MAG TPA: cysteine desulfurase [Patescibacteria group bacterium]|nr:cysteine desulfurase [Patescibacteria group bacterium]